MLAYHSAFIFILQKMQMHIRIKIKLVLARTRTSPIDTGLQLRKGALCRAEVSCQHGKFTLGLDVNTCICCCCWRTWCLDAFFPSPPLSLLFLVLIACCLLNYAFCSLVRRCSQVGLSKEGDTCSRALWLGRQKSIQVTIMSPRQF